MKNVILERHKMKIEDIITIMTGTPQFRIKESLSDTAPTYYFYGQQELENDIVNLELSKESPKSISTLDELNLVYEGDILFSLISGRTTIVNKKHQGYLYTQNYVKLIPKNRLASVCPGSRSGRPPILPGRVAQFLCRGRACCYYIIFSPATTRFILHENHFFYTFFRF